MLLGEIEVRRRSGRKPRLRGSFPYGKLATVRNRGRVRKERIASRAFAFAIEDAEREINLLFGHSFDAPLASRSAGSLVVADAAEAVTFEARLPVEADQPTWMRDAVRAVDAGLIGGISPGFIVPPKGVVPDAERFVPEPGNPDVSIREVRQAVLLELSLVTRPAYQETTVEARALAALAGAAPRRRRVWL